MTFVINLIETNFPLFPLLRHADNVAELYFLQSNGNMMDFPAWRKKPPVPQFLTFKKNYRLDPLATDDNDSIRVSIVLSLVIIFIQLLP